MDGSPFQRRAARGVTLIELMAVIAVLAIVAAVAAPGMQAFAASQRAKSLSYDLVHDLLIARSEALKRGTTVTLTPGAGGWGSGWSVRAGDLVVSERQPESSSLAFDNAPSAIGFNIYGRVTAPLEPVRMTVRSADYSAEVTKRCIEVDPSGYARTKMGACS